MSPGGPEDLFDLGPGGPLFPCSPGCPGCPTDFSFAPFRLKGRPA